MAIVPIKKMTYSRMDIPGLLSPLGGMESFIDKGDSVLLKVNMLSATDPGKVVTTHPRFVTAVAAEVKRCGGKPVIGDSPGGPFTRFWVNRAYKKCGFAELSKKAKIPLNQELGHKFLKVKGAKRYKNVKMGKFVLDADKIIELPKLKTHNYTYITGACKISYGHIPGMTKGKLHAQHMARADFSDMLLDIYLARKPDLYIMDAIHAMEGKGPNSGDVKKMNLALAAKDPVSMDIAFCELIDVEPVRIPVLKQAKIRKMWPEGVEYPLLNPRDIVFKDFKLGPTAGHIRTGSKAKKKIPRINTDKCVGCGQCEQICPKGAVKVKKKATIELKKCISCFCCDEVCPEDAVEIVAAK